MPNADGTLTPQEEATIAAHRAKQKQGTIKPYSGMDITPFISDEQLPYIRKEDVGNYQPMTGEGIYGKGVTREEFLKRNPKWAAAHPDFSTNKKHVGAFQNTGTGYNTHVRKVAYDDLIAKGYPEEEANKIADAWVATQGFRDKKEGKYDPRTADLAFGEFTSSRFEPSFKPYKKPEQKPAAEQEQVGPPLSKGPGVYPQVQGPAPWWKQDVLGVGHNLANLYRTKKYHPWQATPGYVLPEPTFLDPTRALAANAEIANIGTQGLASFTNPQSFAAGFSGIQGQAASQAANTIGQYDNSNVQIANDFELRRKEIMNKQASDRAGLATGLVDKYAILNQQFDDAKGKRRDIAFNSYINGLTNKAYTANLNDLYDQYKINPMRSGRIEWQHGRPNTPESPSDGFASVQATASKLTQQGVPAAQAYKMAFDFHSGNPGQGKSNNMYDAAAMGAYPQQGSEG